MPKLNVVCVKWGDKYGPEYVNILQDMVWRNLTVDHQFICFTDDERGIDAKIQIRMLPMALEGWANKLWLFSGGAALDGPVLFLDLDTIITGRLEDVAEYVIRAQNLTMLKDFYGWTEYGSGVMAWNPVDHFPLLIWEEYVHAGMPQPPKGDQQFICDKASELGFKIDVWQDKLPDVFCSYKLHARKWPPNGCKVVCFHGEPNPHQFPSEWIGHVWKIGGFSEAKLTSKCNTEKAEASGNIRTNMALGLPELKHIPEHNRTMIIVGGAPSLKRSMPEIRKAMRKGDVWAMNGTHDWLMDRGVTPDYFALLDARKDNAKFVQRSNGKTKYLIASHCAPEVFYVLQKRNADITIWHAYEPELRDVIAEYATDDHPLTMLGGGNTVALKLLYMGRMLGYKKFAMFGVDSSYENDNHHAYSQSMNDGEFRLNVFAAGRKFSCAPWMIVQAKDFQDQVRALVNQGCIVDVHGSGLIPFIASQLAAKTEHGQLRGK